MSLVWQAKVIHDEFVSAHSLPASIAKVNGQAVRVGGAHREFGDGLGVG